jgi:hypothetical protein
MPKKAEVKRGRGRTLGGPAKKDGKFKSEEGTPEKKKINKAKLDAYLTSVMSKRGDRDVPAKPYPTWKSQEVELNDPGS